MADTSKEKIIKINTQSAEKGVKTLKQQIKELRDQLGQLEQGTAEYDRVAKQLADVNQRQIEVNEAMKYSNQDVGATFTNLTRVAAGAVGAINGINAVMVMMGADGEAAAEALKQIQLTMAVIQSMNAMAEAGKSLHGLGVAFGLVGKEAQVSEKQLEQSVAGSTGAIVKETSALNTNTTSKAANTAATNTLSKSAVKSKGALTGMTAGSNILTKALKVLKTALTSVWGVIGLVAAAIGGAVKIISDHNDKVHQAAEEIMTYKGVLMELDGEVENEQLSVKTLVDGLNDLNRSLGQRKSIADQLNKIIPELNAHWDEEGKKFVYNEKALNAYNYRVEQHTKYQALLNKQKEAHNKVVEAQIEVEKIQKGYTMWDKQMTNKLEDAQKNYDDALELELYYKKELQKVDYRAANENLETVKKETKETKTLGKSVKELIEMFKELKKELVNTTISYDEIVDKYNGFYDETEQLFKKVQNVIKVNNIEVEKLNEEFRKELETSLIGVNSWDITLDYIFGKDTVQKLKTQLMEEEALLNRYTNQEIKVTQKAYDEQKKNVQILKNKMTAYNDLADAVVKYLSNMEKELKIGKYLYEDRIKDLEKEKDIYLSYITDVKNRNPWAELNKEVSTTEFELEKVKKELKEIAEQENKINKDVLNMPLDHFVDNPLWNKQQIELLKELDERKRELQTQASELERSLEETNYQIRLKHLDEEYEKEKENVEKLNQELRNQRSAQGGGTMDYNTDTDILQNEYNAIKNQMENIKTFFAIEIEDAKKKYKELLNTVAKGSEEYVRIEKERDIQLQQLEMEQQAALTQMEEEGAEKRVQIAQSEFDRKSKVQKAFVNSISAVTGQISNLLSEKMSSYDQDSKEYKRLQITQATINTLSGALAAFVSGFQSGIPWPGNLILAGVLSGLTFATGVQSIENIKKESLKNSSTSSATSGSFGEYDTMTYMNDVDLIDSIQDQRVYVTENDITSTQNRVQVRESEATF